MDPVTSAPSFRFTTIAQVDAAVEADASLKRINSEGIPEYIGPRLTAFEIPFFERSLEFRRLTLLKYFYGLSQEVTRAHARERECNREAARRSPKSPRIYLDAFRKAFRDINDASGDAFGHKVRRFLDLGCAPGGFATWLLKNNKKAQGTGITLSSEAKGLRLQLEPSLRGRFQVHYEDVCRVAMGRVALGDLPRQGYDLVVANASFTLADNKVQWKDAIGLIYAQLLLAFRHVAINGSLVLSINARPLRWVVDIIQMLRGVFRTVMAVNPPYQAKRSFMYLVCRSFRATGDERYRYERRLRKCVEYLENITGPVDAASGGTTDLPLLCGEKDDPVSEDMIEYVVDTFREGWTRQHAAIRANYERVLVQAALADGQTSEEGAQPFNGEELAQDCS